MINIQRLRSIQPKAISIVSHPGIIQSVFDFDYLAGKTEPSIVGIVGTGKKFERYFFGNDEVLIPLFPTYDQIPTKLKNEINLFLSNASGRRTYSTAEQVLTAFPNLLVGVIFAENVPEKLAVELYHKAA